MSFGSGRDLLDAVNAHAELITSSSDSDVLYGLPAFLDFIQTQPLLTPVLEGLERDAREWADRAKSHVASAKSELEQMLEPVFTGLAAAGISEGRELDEEVRSLISKLSPEFASPVRSRETLRDPWALGPCLDACSKLLWRCRGDGAGWGVSRQAEEAVKALIGLRLKHELFLRRRDVRLNSSPAVAWERMLELKRTTHRASFTEDDLLEEMFNIGSVADVLAGTSLMEVAAGLLTAA